MSTDLISGKYYYELTRKIFGWSELKVLNCVGGAVSYTGLRLWNIYFIILCHDGILGKKHKLNGKK